MRLNQVLYYPYIHFRDESWVKYAALYWDGLSRIAPRGVQLRDSRDIEEFRDANFIRNRNPEKSATTVEKPFIEFIEENQEALARTYSVTERSEVVYVFGTKVSMNLLSCMAAAGLTTSRIGDPRWIGMHPQLARVYMTALAEDVALRTRARPITDSSTAHVAVSGLSTERLASLLLSQSFNRRQTTTDEVEQYMATIVINCAVPRDLHQISVSQILKIREATKKSREAFQSQITQMLRDFGPSGYDYDLDVLKEYAADYYQQHINPAVKRTHEDLISANINTGEKLMAVSFAAPAGLATLAQHLGSEPVVTSIAGGALAIWKIFRQRDTERRNALTPSAATFLADVNRMTSKSLVSRIAAISRR